MKPKHAKKKVKPWVPEVIHGNGFEFMPGRLSTDWDAYGDHPDWDIEVVMLRRRDYERLLKLASQSGRGER